MLYLVSQSSIGKDLMKSLTQNEIRSMLVDCNSLDKLDSLMINSLSTKQIDDIHNESRDACILNMDEMVLDDSIDLVHQENYR